MNRQLKLSMLMEANAASLKREGTEARAVIDGIGAAAQAAAPRNAALAAANEQVATSARQVVSVLSGQTAALDRERQTLTAGTAAIRARTNALRETATAARAAQAAGGTFQTANIAAQFQDIGVTAAMGMSPLQIALQQGTQLSAILQTMESPARGLLAALTQVLNPLSLATIGIVAAGTALIQYFTEGAQGVRSLDDALRDHVELIDQIKAAYGEAALARRDFTDADAREFGVRLAASTQELQVRQEAMFRELIGSKTLGRMNVGLNAEGINTGSFSAVGEFREFNAAVEKLYRDGVAGLVNGAPHPAALTGDGERTFSVTLSDKATAALSNALGVYEVDAAGNIVDARILFADVKASPTATIAIDGVEAGHRLGFFIVNDGVSGDLSDIRFVNGAGAAANISDGNAVDLLVGGAKIDAHVFHAFASALNDDGLTHVRSGADPSGNGIRMAFEDLFEAGDSDFQDVVFRVDVLDVSGDLLV